MTTLIYIPVWQQSASTEDNFPFVQSMCSAVYHSLHPSLLCPSAWRFIIMGLYDFLNIKKKVKEISYHLLCQKYE